MTTIPSIQRAIIADSNGSLTLSNNAPVPALQGDMILVKTAAVALNPVDAKMTGKRATPGAVSGFDFAGVVVALGVKESNSRFKIGDRVCGAVTGQNPLDLTEGSFAEYIGARVHATLKIPDHMSFEDAATLGVGIGTVGLALFRSLNPAPRATVLVHGASSATGTLAIQILRHFGHIPIGTCSPRNFDLVQSRGAENVFDYNIDNCAADIKIYTKNSLRYVLDCVSNPDSLTFCHSCIGRRGGFYTALEPYPEALHTRQTVKADWVLQLEVLGKKIGWPQPFAREVSTETKEWAESWFQTVQGLLDAGKLQVHPVKVMPGGFDRILEGLDLVREKKVSGQKLVYTIP
ncbi:hypothetical protein VTN77DRAFT_4665 [Rasamsonia byssochlamydoides]|uniref:uncharacterized protein n=1 Tax=Rasamsonia byssochlamydoides TaxID=89139 RepID=UPI0037443329